tara:strand:+ start:197 stop:1237 length:1041 start_codon:yes stop_codon:yes gene_type:complete
LEYKIRLLEPWGGGHHEFDTGYGNRVQHWETVYKLQMICGTDHNTQVEQHFWHEKKFVDFPGMIAWQLWHTNPEIQSKVAKWDFDHHKEKWTKLVPITNKMVDDILDGKTDTLKNGIDYYTAFDWYKVDQVLSDTNYKTVKGSRQIKIIDPTFRKSFSKMLGMNTIGVHLRRGAGVFKSKKEMLEFSETLQDNDLLNQNNPRSKESIYKYVNDRKVTRLLQDIIAERPKAQFYISTDLPTMELKKITDQLPEGTKVFTRDDFYKHVPKYTHSTHLYESTNLERTGLETVIDQSALRACKIILGHPVSTWTLVAAYSTDLLTYHLTDPIDKVLANIKYAFKRISRLN